MPPWLGYVAAFTEFFGGLLLILGLLTRVTRRDFRLILTHQPNVLTWLLPPNLREAYYLKDASTTLHIPLTMRSITGSIIRSVRKVNSERSH